MINCRNRKLIDDYLLDRLSSPARDRFEEHLFNCDQCFRDVRERQAMLAAVRAHGPRIFAGRPVQHSGRLGWLRYWPYAFAGAAALLAAWIGLRPEPDLPDLAPLTAPVGDAVRGAAVEMVAPLGLQPKTPAVLEWKPAGAGADYNVEIRGPGWDWSARSGEARLELPAEIRAKLLPGVEYRWKVRAFAPEGGLLAVSKDAVFRIAE